MRRLRRVQHRAPIIFDRLFFFVILDLGLNLWLSLDLGFPPSKYPSSGNSFNFTDPLARSFFEKEKSCFM
jgi:hypothetical protein